MSFESMIEKETHEMSVSFWEGDSHIFYSTCSNGNMGKIVATIAKHLFLLEVSHVCDGVPHGDTLLSITFEAFWDDWVYSVGGRNFTGLILMMPLEGNVLAAQDQFALYTYLKWRGEQCGVGYLVYHV